MLSMCWLQLLAEVKTTLRHQVTVEYNATATYSSQTRSRTYRITVAWDSLQTRVMTRFSLADQIKVNDVVAYAVLMVFTLALILR